MWFAGDQSIDWVVTSFSRRQQTGWVEEYDVARGERTRAADDGDGKYDAGCGCGCGWDGEVVLTCGTSHEIELEWIIACCTSASSRIE